jgi:hypothetical protein
MVTPSCSKKMRDREVVLTRVEVVQAAVPDRRTVDRCSTGISAASVGCATRCAQAASTKSPDSAMSFSQD